MNVIDVLWEYAKDFFYYRTVGIEESKRYEMWQEEQIRLIKKAGRQNER